MSDKPKKTTPPYTTIGAFVSLLNKLRDTGVPSRIDPSVFGNASGSVSYSVIAALKFLRLIDDDGKPSKAFTGLVKATDDARPALLAQVIRDGYPSLFGGALDLTNATAAEFDEHMRKEFDVQGSTVDKIATFFILAAKQAGIELSPHLAARKSVSGSSSSKKSAKQRKRDDQTPADDVNDTPPPPITEKALEYRLVDLMSEAAGDAEVMGAIIKVITFLKTRETSE